jgi:hypothetical protein
VLSPGSAPQVDNKSLHSRALVAADSPTVTENLEKVGYAGWKKLIMRVEAVGCDVTCFKRQARADVAKDHTIIANIGDQWSDLDPLVNDTTKGSQAERIFKLPNPYLLHSMRKACEGHQQLWQLSDIQRNAPRFIEGEDASDVRRVGCLASVDVGKRSPIPISWRTRSVYRADFGNNPHGRRVSGSIVCCSPRANLSRSAAFRVAPAASNISLSF